MGMEAGLKAFVAALPAVSSKIGGRMYPVFAPESADAPYVVYRRLSTPRLGTMTGSGTPRPMFRLTCWAATYEEAIALADAVRSGVNGHKGAMGSVTVQRSAVVDESDAFEPSPELLTRQMFGRQLDVEIWHNE